MPVLATSEAVINRTGIRGLAEYTDLIPITDAPGFAVRRSYPPDTDLARVVNAQGEQLIKVIIQFIVPPPSSARGVTPVTLRAWAFPRSKQTRLFAGLHELPAGDPDAPTSDSLQRWRLARKPSEVELIGQFVYDAGEDRFLNSEGREITPAEMLERVYQAHLRTLRTSFVWRQQAESFVQWIARVSVFRLQDGLMWIILNRYDVELALRRDRISPFH